MKKETKKVVKFKKTKEVTLTLSEHLDILNKALVEVRANGYTDGFDDGYVKGKSAGVELSERVRKLNRQIVVSNIFEWLLLTAIGVSIGFLIGELIIIFVR